MIRDLSFICSNCEKSCLTTGVFLSSNGVQEGFCSFLCVYTWLGKKFAEKKKEVLRTKKLEVGSLVQVGVEKKEEKKEEKKREKLGAPPPSR